MEKITFEEVQQALIFAAREIGARLGNANLPADDRDRLKRRRKAFEAALQMVNELATERLLLEKIQGPFEITVAFSRYRRADLIADAELLKKKPVLTRDEMAIIAIARAWPYTTELIEADFSVRVTVSPFCLQWVNGEWQVLPIDAAAPDLRSNPVPSKSAL